MRHSHLHVCGLIAALSLGACKNFDNRSVDGPNASSPPGHLEECTPQCPQDSCGDDGCGGTCACTEPNTVCSASFRCVPPEQCDDTCASAGWQCGELCGTVCGPCGEGTCFWNACVSGPRDQACSDCALRLSVREQTDGEVTLSIDYDGGGENAPRIVDLRLQASHPVSLVRVTPGNALTDAGKDLYRDPASGQLWRNLGHQIWGILGISLSNMNSIASGPLAELTFDLSGVEPGASVAFRLVKRHETFAPADADMALQGESYDAAVVVERSL